jgi:hypothetical protein
VSAPYRPGQPQWPDNRPQRPERPPPIQFRQEAPPPGANKAAQWALRIAGLVAVAVLSGVVWYYVTDDDTSTPAGEDTGTPQQTEGLYEFTAHEDMPSPKTDTDCAAHAYGDIRDFLAASPCDHLSRQLFVTKADGRTVYTSVSVVTMPDEQKAGELRDLTDKDGSGNVSDVVKDELVTIEGLDGLAGGGGYASKQDGRDVIIVESDFDPGDKSGDEDADDDALDKVCVDALRLSDQVDGGGSGG